MRIIGLDIHRAFTEAVAWDEGEPKRLGRVDMHRHLLEAFATKLTKDDVVVVEATGNAASVAAVIIPHVKKVVIANPKQVRIIAHAKIETDTIDASVLAQLYASGFLPEVWIPDQPTQALRRQVTRRNQIVRQRSRLKNIIQSILDSHLIPSCPHADLCGASGRVWLFHQVLPEDERLAVERHLREFDRLGEDLKVIERDLARSALGDEGVKRLMTIPGVDMVVALAIVAAIGDVGRFEQSQKLVSYLGLNLSVRQSGPGPAYHGWITKQGRGHARGMLVEAAWAAARAPDPLRAFFLRVRARRGQHVAAVATARKLAVLIWHLLSKDESYVWARPALHARKLGDLALKAGYKTARGQRGAAHAYNIKSHRDQERRWVEQAETAYARFVAGWNPRGPSRRAQEPQMRGDNEGCAAGLAPRALLFAARSPVREKKITSIPQESTCRSRALGLGARMVDILERQVELIFVVLGVAAIFRAAISQHADELYLPGVVERDDPVVEQVGRGDRRLAIELGEGDFGVGVDEGLLVDAPDPLHVANVEGVLSPAIARAFALELAMRLLFALGLLQRGELALGQHQAFLATLASRAFSRFFIVSRSWRCQTPRTPAGEIECNRYGCPTSLAAFG